MDTNILVDVAAGVPAALAEVRQYEDRAISVISRIEFLAGVGEGERRLADILLGNFAQIELTAEIAEAAAVLRRSAKLKLPDAVILATAQVQKRVLLTRNTRDFVSGQFVRVPYTL